jgi:hypothetical protein
VAPDILAGWFGLRARQDSAGQPPGAWFDPTCLDAIIRRVLPERSHQFH